MRAPLIVVIAFILLVGNAFAANITISPSEPNTNVVSEVSLPGSNDASDLVYRSAGEYQYFGQTFTVTSGFTLSAVSFKIYQEDSADRSTDGMTMKLDVFSVNTLDDQTGTTLFASPQTGVTPAYPKGTYQWMTIDVDNIFLVPGIYATTIDFAFPLNHPAIQGGHKIGGDNPAGLQFSNGSTPESAYPAGRGFRRGTAGVANLNFNDDLTWIIQQGSPAVDGDFDGDGDVDGADFVAWQTNFPKESGATLEQGDADADGDVDGADFVVWQTNFPFPSGSGASPVPEPAVWAIALFASLGLITVRWRHKYMIVPKS